MPNYRIPFTIAVEMNLLSVGLCRSILEQEKKFKQSVENKQNKNEKLKWMGDLEAYDK